MFREEDIRDEEPGQNEEQLHARVAATGDSARKTCEQRTIVRVYALEHVVHEDEQDRDSS